MYRAAAWAVAALLAILLFALVFTLGYVSNGDDGAGSAQEAGRGLEDINISSDVDFRTLNQILEILRSDYFDQEKLDDRALYEAAIQGLLDSLADTGTFYIDPETFQIAIGPSGSFEGIGATVRELNGQIVIAQPYEGSPAEAAGLEPGDVILAVDGESIEGWSVDKAALRIRGPKGTDVTLTIRHLDGTTVDFTITRDEIQVASVGTIPPAGVLRDAQGNEVTDLAYVRISEFNQNTPQEVETAVRDAEADGKRGLILDVRVNPGGLLRETVETADLFLDEGVILIELDREENETFHRAQPGGAALEIPIVILQDESSASGAEVLAAALKDNGRAMIVGEKSHGKGTVNIERDLSDGGALFVTIRKWLTPSGVQIDGVGITPDVEVTPGPFDPGYDALEDAQIFRAIEQLHEIAASSPTP